MIDHLLGRPNPSWKRTQVCLFPQPTPAQAHPALGLSRHHLLDLETRPRESRCTTLLVAETIEQETTYVLTSGIVSLLPLTRVTERFSPWQIIVSTLTTVYALKNLDKIVGLGCKLHPSLS